LRVVRALEAEPALLGASAHLLLAARKEKSSSTETAIESMNIVNVSPDSPFLGQMAELLVAGFREHWHAWETVDEGVAEVREILGKGFARAALDEDGATVLGWIGGLPGYDGQVWELHPLVVAPARQKQGLGRALVADFETQVQSRVGLTIQLGSDDEDDMTSLAGADLYDRLWDRIAHIRNLKGHPYEFYQKCGYTITGVVPDANGRGKPDILMSKRVGG
jgi:aminoglycoside 6'-N-acetyltransferase I